MNGKRDRSLDDHASHSGPHSGGRFATVFRRIHGIPERLPSTGEVASIRDLEWAANTFVWERGFAWRQSSLRILQLQTLGLFAYALCLAIGTMRPAVGFLLASTAWSLLHMRAQTLDMKRCREARDLRPVLAGLDALGGFGGLPAMYAMTLLTEAPTDEQGSADLYRSGKEWQRRNLAETEIRETFMLLAPEFDGTADELRATSESLTRT